MLCSDRDDIVNRRQTYMPPKIN